MANLWDEGRWQIGTDGRYWWLEDEVGVPCVLTISVKDDAYWISNDDKDLLDGKTVDYELGPLESLDLAKKAYRVLLATHRY